MEGISIRMTAEGELEQCADVIRRGFGTVAKAYGLTRENCPTGGAFLQSSRLVRERQKGFLLYSLFYRGFMIGFVELEPLGEGVYVLEKLTVLPEYRHYGFGRYLLDFAVREAGRLGGHKVVLGMIEQNQKLKNWYQSYGFVQTETKRFPHLPFAVGMMELFLPAAGA